MNSPGMVPVMLQPRTAPCQCGIIGEACCGKETPVTCPNDADAEDLLCKVCRADDVTHCHVMMILFTKD
jgi:hypothetical protein